MRYISSIAIEVFLAVMQHHLFWVIFVTYLSFFNKCETKQPQEDNGVPNILSKLLRNRNKPPIVIYIEPSQNDRSIEENQEHLRQYDMSIEDDPKIFRQYDRSIEVDQKVPRERIRSIEDNPDVFREENDEEDSNENLLRTSKTDERAYLLYHLLRSTLEEEDVDPRTVQRLQPAKEFLRNAFIGRCRKLNKCRKKCSTKKTIKLTCTMQCKQTFDDLDECDEPKETKCGVTKCGHTMPPSWLL